MNDCPKCGDPHPPVEGLCWECGHRRGFPVPIPVWEGEPPQDIIWTDEDYSGSLEVPPL